MEELTAQQKRILDFIRTHQQTEGVIPTLREIADHFGFRSMTAAADHVRALQRKGHLAGRPRHARSLRVITPLDSLRRQVVDVPVYGAIPAGFASEQQEEAVGCISMDVKTLGVRSRGRIFALQVHGDSMVGKNILDRDYVIVEQGRTPQTGDVVAALVDNESTLKTYMMRYGKPYLKAENPKYPDIIPAIDLAIQGVMVALVRRATR
jgi:repressor LexA